AGDLPQASSLCGACTEVCPVGIPLHEQLLMLRADVARSRGWSGDRMAAAAWSAAWRRPAGYRVSAAVARLGQRLFVRRGRIRRGPFPLSRWTRGRDLPPVAARTFRERWARRGEKG